MFPQANAAFAHGLAVEDVEEQDPPDEGVLCVLSYLAYIYMEHATDVRIRLDRSPEDVQEFKYQCEQYMKVMPHFKDDLDFLLLDPTALIVYGKYVRISLSSLPVLALTPLKINARASGFRCADTHTVSRKSLASVDRDFQHC